MSGQHGCSSLDSGGARPEISLHVMFNPLERPGVPLLVTGHERKRQLIEQRRHRPNTMSAIASARSVVTSARASAAGSSVRASSRVDVAPRSRHVARAATLRGAPDATLGNTNSLTSDDVSSWDEIQTQVANMCAKFAGDSSVNGRIMALTELGPEKTYEALDDITVVDVYQAVS